MIHAALIGRLGSDAEKVETRTGKAMAKASVAVEARTGETDAAAMALWVRVLAFGKLAERLQAHRKGDVLSVSGKLELQCWIGKDGQARESWQLVADDLHSARISGMVRSIMRGNSEPH